MRRLNGPGIQLRTGPVVTRIRSDLPAIADGIRLYYAEHAVEDPSDFADFDVRVGTPRNLRRWFKRQAMFDFDGATPFKPLPHEHAFPMLEWGLNWCISSQCNQYLSIHAAVVEKDGRAVVLPAPPGSGKSTLCAGLVTRGWRLLSDELTLLDPTTGRISPLARPVSLKNASIDVMRAFSASAVIGPVVHDTKKGSVAHMKPPAESVRRGGESAEPGFVILPRYKAASPPLLTPVSKAAAFMQLADNAFNYHLHGRRGFEALGLLIDRSRCFEFVYSRLDDAIATFDELARGA